MQITIYSFLTTVFWSSILIMLLFSVRKILRSYDAFNIQMLIFMYLLCLVRTIFPFEPDNAKVIEVPEVLNRLYLAANGRLIDNGLVSLCGYDCMVILWTGVAVILLIRLLGNYYKVMYELRVLRQKKGAEEYTFQGRSGKRTAYVIELSGIFSPMSIGGIRSNYILFPEQEYTGEQKKWILQHECNHLQNYDTAVKVLIGIFCAFFWFNPVAYLMKRDLEQTLEIRCDIRSVAGLSNEQKADYMETLLSVFRQTDGDAYNCRYRLMSCLSRDENGLKERMEILSGALTDQKEKIRKKIMPGIVSMTVFMMSYTCVFQTHYLPPEEEVQNAVMVDKNTAQIVMRTDGFELITSDGICRRISRKTAELMEREEGIRVIQE
ncbi:MAG: M56 family metallopeptidase [Butyrivibrio sp.]|jgi:beta-lactamase regulating signal transducer with metallopeptidase domain|nr:M56 family metallopeptidase [Butyrivibrio sp.]